MRIISLFITLLTCVIALCLPAQAASPEQSVKEGNLLYNQGKYDEAVQKYREAKDQSPDSDIAGFNLGAALFKKGDYKESIDAFTQSLHTENRELEADAAYNIANAKYNLGAELLNTDLNGAADLYRESLDYYKRAIELNEAGSDAKYNHELVEKELKVILDRIKNQPPPQQDEKGNDKEQKEDNQEQQSQEKSGEDKDKQEQKQDQKQQNEKQEAGDDRKQEQESADQQKTDQGEDQKEASGPGEEATEKMSPEEAKMLLDSFADEESMDNLKKKKQRYNTEVLKDW